MPNEQQDGDVPVLLALQSAGMAAGAACVCCLQWVDRISVFMLVPLTPPALSV